VDVFSSVVVYCVEDNLESLDVKSTVTLTAVTIDSCVVEPVISRVEDVGELLIEVIPVGTSVPVPNPVVVIADIDDVIVTSVEAVD